MNLPHCPFPEHSIESQWEPQPSNAIKVNCDASYDHASCKSGIEAILRDDKGQIVGVSKVLLAVSVNYA
ncbi:hypothetical protein V6N13_122632 [Hibiscus sabdariffa]